MPLDSYPNPNPNPLGFLLNIFLKHKLPILSLSTERPPPSSLSLFFTSHSLTSELSIIIGWARAPNNKELIAADEIIERFIS